MDITYAPTCTCEKDLVRFIIGVVVEDDGVAQDEEILWTLTTEHNVWMAAAAVALAVGRRLRSGGVQDLLVGETRIRYDRALEMLALVKDLRARGMAHMQPSAGGVFVADTEAYDANTALEQPNISVGMHDNPQFGAGADPTLRAG